MEVYRDFSKIYDELIQEDIDYGQIASFILNHDMKKGRYLDLGCGTGSLSLIIGKNFKESYLVDLSPEMLTEAVAKFTSEKIAHRAFAISMDEINFPCTFNLVTSSIDALNYLLDQEDVQEVFHRVFKHLDKNGVFIFDVQSPYKIREILGNNDYVYTSEEVVYTWENFLEDDVVEMSLNFFVKEGDTYRRIEEVHEEKAYEPELLQSMLAAAGFSSVELFDNYSEQPLVAETERITIIARKR